MVKNFGENFKAKLANFGKKWDSSKKRFSPYGLTFFLKQKRFSKTRINSEQSLGALFFNLAFNFSINSILCAGIYGILVKSHIKSKISSN